jgi:hypothetical protein
LVALPCTSLVEKWVIVGSSLKFISNKTNSNKKKETKFERLKNLTSKIKKHLQFDRIFID